MELLEQLTNAQCEFFLFETRKIAFPAIARATVVDVLPFLDFACNSAAVVRTVDQTSKRDLCTNRFLAFCLLRSAFGTRVALLRLDR